MAKLNAERHVLLDGAVKVYQRGNPAQCFTIMFAPTADIGILCGERQFRAQTA